MEWSKPPRCPLRATGLWGLLAWAPWWCAPASGQVEITPQLGLYVPLSALMEAPSHLRLDPASRRQVLAVSLGVQAAYWFGHDAALEGTLVYSPSMVAERTVSAPGVSVVDVPAHALLAGVRGLVPLLVGRDSMRWTVMAAAGMATVHRFGAAWKGYGGTTDWAGVIGFVFRSDPPGVPGFRLEATDYVSWGSFVPRHGGRSAFPTRLRHDLVWSAGFSIPL